MHKHGRHNTEAIFSSVVIRIHLFKSILGGTGEHWIFQVDHISPAMGKKKKKRRNFCNRPNSRPAKWRKWEKQTTGPRFAPRGRWFSLCVFGVTHCDIVTGNREVLQQKPIYVSQLHPNDPHKIIRLTAGRSEFSRLASMCSHPIDTGGINAAFYVTQHMNSLSADSVWFGPRDQNKKAKKKECEE